MLLQYIPVPIAKIIKIDESSGLTTVKRWLKSGSKQSSVDMPRTYRDTDTDTGVTDMDTNFEQNRDTDMYMDTNFEQNRDTDMDTNFK